MKLVFIHGPVASGKLTIARALGQLSGFAVFQAHEPAMAADRRRELMATWARAVERSRGWAAPSRADA